MTAVLHTWGQQMEEHIHIHIVDGGRVKPGYPDGHRWAAVGDRRRVSGIWGCVEWSRCIGIGCERIKRLYERAGYSRAGRIYRPVGGLRARNGKCT